MDIILIIVIAVLAIIILWFLGVYNKLIVLRNRVKDQFHQIDVQLQRRSDLIPNLVATVKGYAKHEEETLENVVKARSNYASANTPTDKMEAANELSSCVNKLLMLQEAYPELKANTNFLQLQDDLKDTEDKVSISRQFYNDAVLKYNNAIAVIPNNIVAALFHFKEEPFFEASSEDRKAPKVEF